MAHYRMHMVLVQLLQLQPKKNIISYCLRSHCHSALFNGFLSWTKNKRSIGFRYWKMTKPPRISGHVLYVPNQNTAPNLYWYSSYSNCNDNSHSPVRKLFDVCYSSSFHTSSYCESNDDSARRISLIKKINDGLGLSHSARLATKLSKTSREILSPDEESENILTLEKKLLYLMEFWELDDAIFLLKVSIAGGESPDATVVFNMLRQIATLGKVECLLDLYDSVLKKAGLIPAPKFFQCLGLAVSVSGRVTDGMDILTQKYHEGMSPGEVDTLFTILATEIIKNFEHHCHLVEGFVDSLLSREPPFLSARALLWKCYVLAEKFDGADELRSKYELIKLIPEQVSTINHLSSSNSPVAFNREAVLLWLIQQPYLKSRLRAYTLHMLVQQKCEAKEWGKAINFLSVAMDNNVNPQQETMVNFLSVFFDECTDDESLMFWKIVGEHVKIDEVKSDTDGENTDADKTNA